MPRSTAPSGAANESDDTFDAPFLRIISSPPLCPREEQNLRVSLSSATSLSRAPFLAVHTMDGHASTSAVDRQTTKPAEALHVSLPSPSHRPTPPSSPVEPPQLPTE